MSTGWHCGLARRFKNPWFVTNGLNKITFPGLAARGLFRPVTNAKIHLRQNLRGITVRGLCTMKNIIREILHLKGYRCQGGRLRGIRRWGRSLAVGLMDTTERGILFLRVYIAWLFINVIEDCGIVVCKDGLRNGRSLMLLHQELFESNACAPAPVGSLYASDRQK